MNLRGQDRDDLLPPNSELRLATNRLDQRLTCLDNEIVALRDTAHLLQEEVTLKLAERTNRKLGAAKRWLHTLLDRGPVYSGDVLDVAFVCGVPFRSLEQAKLELGIRFEPGNLSKFACWRLWWWALPDDDRETAVEAFRLWRRLRSVSLINQS